MDEWWVDMKHFFDHSHSLTNLYCYCCKLMFLLPTYLPTNRWPYLLYIIIIIFFRFGSWVPNNYFDFSKSISVVKILIYENMGINIANFIGRFFGL